MPGAMWAYTFSGDGREPGLGLGDVAWGDADTGTVGAAGDAPEQPQANPATVATANRGAIQRGPTVLVRRLPTVCTLAKIGTPWVRKSPARQAFLPWLNRRQG